MFKKHPSPQAPAAASATAIRSTRALLDDAQLRHAVGGTDDDVADWIRRGNNNPNEQARG